PASIEPPLHQEESRAHSQQGEGQVDARLDPLEGPEAVRRLIAQVVAAIPSGLHALQRGLRLRAGATNCLDFVPLSIKEPLSQVPILYPQRNRRLITFGQVWVTF